MKKEIKLYNIFFPFWMLMMIPTMWIFVMPVNFIVDSLVLLICMKVLQIEGKKQFYKSNILKLFAFGLLSDAIGSALLFVGAYILELGNIGDELYLTIPGLIIAGVCIFLFDYFIALRKSDKAVRFKIALTFAIATAPYTFLIPSSWIYR